MDVLVDPLDQPGSFAFGERLGWKALKVIEAGQHVRLASEYGHGDVRGELTLWPTDRWYVALCPFEGRHDPADIPAEGCTCGIYAKETREQLISSSYPRYEDGGPNLVIAVIGFVGKVIPGTTGMRGALARVARLEVPYEKEPLARKLSEAYDVPAGLGLLFPRS